MSKKDFPNLDGKGLAIILNNKLHSTKVYICAADNPFFNEKALEWCDVYAKVNIDKTHIPEEFKHKILPIGPSFGIQVYGPVDLFLYYLISLIASRKTSCLQRDHIANFWRQYKYRLPLSEYIPGLANENYVFFVSTLWKLEMRTNWLRSSFMDACKTNSDLIFEGGFPPRHDGLKYKNHMITRRYAIHEYLQKTKDSAFVFNTPACMKCHGWKLGEYLALGKAIISTTLTREMPAPLIHGEHVHFVEDTYQSIESAVALLYNNKLYRSKLEQGARRYYLNYLEPSKVIERILRFTPYQ